MSCITGSFHVILVCISVQIYCILCVPSTSTFYKKLVAVGTLLAVSFSDWMASYWECSVSELLRKRAWRTSTYHTRHTSHVGGFAVQQKGDVRTANRLTAVLYSQNNIVSLEDIMWNSSGSITWQLRALSRTCSANGSCFTFTESDSFAASYLCEAAAATAASHDSSGPSARLLQAQCSWPTKSNPGQFWRTEHQGTTGTVHYFVTKGETKRFWQSIHILCTLVLAVIYSWTLFIQRLHGVWNRYTTWSCKVVCVCVVHVTVTCVWS